MAVAGDRLQALWHLELSTGLRRPKSRWPPLVRRRLAPVLSPSAPSARPRLRRRRTGAKTGAAAASSPSTPTSSPPAAPGGSASRGASRLRPAYGTPASSSPVRTVRYHPQRCRSRFAACCEKAGLEAIRFHGPQTHRCDPRPGGGNPSQGGPGTSRPRQRPDHPRHLQPCAARPRRDAPTGSGTTSVARVDRSDSPLPVPDPARSHSRSFRPAELQVCSGTVLSTLISVWPGFGA